MHTRTGIYVAQDDRTTKFITADGAVLLLRSFTNAKINKYSINLELQLPGTYVYAYVCIFVHVCACTCVRWKDFLA